MNLEELDGFSQPSSRDRDADEYYPEVFGGEKSEACEFGSLDGSQ
jgi:hypothetical protein